MSVDLLLRMLAWSLPPLARARYLEEWRTDAAGATEAGLRRRDVILGALALCLTLDRAAPTHTGEPRAAVPRRLARRGLALFAAAGAILAGAWLTGGGIVPEGPVPSAAGFALDAAAWGSVRLALLIAVLGVLYLVRAAMTAETAFARVVLGVAIVGPLALAVGVAVPELWPAAVFGLLLSAAGLFGGFFVIGGSTPLTLLPRTSARRRRVPIAAAGVALVVAVAIVGAVDIMVWNPQAKVPGLGLATIYARMAAFDGFSAGYSITMVIVWAAFWTALALAALLVAARRRSAWFTPRRIAVVMLGLVAGAVFFRFFAGFGFGMSIADTFATSGGDASVVSAFLPYLGQLALAGSAVALGWAPRRAAMPFTPVLAP
jgi:hypothetical protein